MDNKTNMAELLAEGSQEYIEGMDTKLIHKFLAYKDLLVEWNKKINLTAIEDDKDVIIKHFIDSLSILPYLERKELEVIDIGTGAGFPGIPVKIVRNDVKVTLLDSLDKRIKFLNEVIGTLQLKGIKAIHGRAEDFALKAEHREKYDVAVARAVASLPVLLEYCLPYVKINGIVLAMKGSNLEEVTQSDKALEILGGRIEIVKELILPFSDIKRNIIVIRKLRQTPTKYPRKAGKPAKEPLI